MHVDCEAPGERDPRLAHGRARGDCECPVLQLQLALVARQHDVCCFVEQGSITPVANLGDAADIVDLTRLVASRNEAEIGAKISRPAEAAWIVDGRRERESGQRAYAGDRHQPAASIGRADELLDICVDRRDRSEHRVSGGNEPAHGAGQASDPVAHGDHLVYKRGI